MAFLHDPEAPSLLGSDASSGVPDSVAFTAQNGKHVSGYGGDGSIYVRANRDVVWDTEIWVVAPFGNISGHALAQDDPGFKVTVGGRVALLAPSLGPVWMYSDPTGTNPTDVEFIFHEQSGWKFTMDAWVTLTAQGGGGVAFPGFGGHLRPGDGLPRVH